MLPVRCIVNLTVAVRVEQHQINRSVVMVVTILMMEFNLLIELNPLPAEGTAPLLWVQDLSTKR